MDAAVSSSAPLSVPSGLSSQNLLLDSDIRDWVVIPLLVIMICAGLLRHYVGLWMRAEPKPIHKVEQRCKSTLASAARLRMANSQYLSTSKIEARRVYYAQRDEGKLRTEAEWSTEEKERMEDAGAGGSDEAMNPMAMMDGMKGNMVFMVQNMVMMQGISHFFKGFILLKVPFSLTRGFKMMFQRDLGLSNLDTSYVSSVSWYFLVMFGLRGFFRLIIGDPTQEMNEDSQRQHQLGLHTQMGPAQFDAPKALQQEADNIELLPKHKSDLDDVEKRLLGKRYPRKRMQAKDDLYGYGTVSGKTKKKV
mmetsp:Transcript_14580/g.24752  ORF Transcript_14580/g.24752 Transcript_14580/m.24752 type:complete len:306 (-) Transcript_14580:35-952(-)